MNTCVVYLVALVAGLGVSRGCSSRCHVDSTPNLRPLHPSCCSRKQYNKSYPLPKVSSICSPVELDLITDGGGGQAPTAWAGNTVTTTATARELEIVLRPASISPLDVPSHAHNAIQQMTQVGPSRVVSSPSWQSALQLQQASGPAEAAVAGKHRHLEVVASRRRELGHDARGEWASTSLLLDTAEASSADFEHDLLPLDDSKTDLRRRRLEANRPQADGSADADSDGNFSPWVMAAGGWGLVDLRGQCSDGDSFTVTSPSIPSAEGCYTSVPGTSFGEGFLYSTEDSAVTTTIYPKIITKDGTSNVSASLYRTISCGVFSSCAR